MIKTAVFYDSKGMVARVRTGMSKVVDDSIKEEDRSYLLFYGAVDTENKYVADGELVSMPEKPGDSYEFNYETKQWQLNLTEAKKEKWREIKNSRTMEEFGEFTWNSQSFQCNELSQQRLWGIAQRAQIDSSLEMDWTLTDNTVVTLTAPQFTQIAESLSDHINACHTKARGLRSQIDAAETESAIAAITW